MNRRLKYHDAVDGGVAKSFAKRNARLPYGMPSAFFEENMRALHGLSDGCLVAFGSNR